MQNSKHPEDAQRCSFISLQITSNVNLYLSECERHSDETLASALTYIFINRSKQRGSRTGLGCDLLKLERTDHDWQPWRLHGEALLPVRVTWEQRGRNRSWYWSQRSYWFPLLRALPFSLQLSLTMRRGDICILRIPNTFLMRSL